MAPSDRERPGPGVTVTGGQPPLPLRVQGEVLAVRRAGAHRVITLSAPGISAAYRPGTFVTVSPGGEHLAARSWWIHRVQSASAFGPTLDLVVDPAGAGGRWLSELPVSTKVAVTGPLGRPFTLPRSPVATLLVAEDHAVSPLLGLAERLRARDCSVTMMVGARDEQHLFAVLESRRLASQVTVVTADGSVGRRGTVAEHLASVLRAGGVGVVYTAGSTDRVRPVARLAHEWDVACQVALEHPMPCGIGLCHGCVVPIRAADGTARQVRACLEGPVLPGDRVRWEEM